MEKDLRVFVQENKKFDRQINEAVKRANSAIKNQQTFNYLDVNSLFKLYKAFIHPNLEYMQEDLTSQTM